MTVQHGNTGWVHGSEFIVASNGGYGCEKHKEISKENIHRPAILTMQMYLS